MRAILLASAFVAVALPAAAATTSYDFRVVLTSGPLAGRSLHGSFAIDSALVAGSNDYANAAGLGIAAIDFTFGGAHFTSANADATFLSFDNGTLIDFALGGLPSGYDLIDSSDAAADFLVDGFGVGYKLAGDNQFIFGGDTTRFQATVPEPATLALFGLGFVGLTARRALRA